MKYLLIFIFSVMLFLLVGCNANEQVIYPALEDEVVATPSPSPSPVQTNPVQVEEKQMEITLTDNRFPFPFAFITEDVYGNQITEANLGEYEAFFVYFWTTWCPSCVAAMPDLAQLAHDYAGRVGFVSLLGDFNSASDIAIRIKEEAGVYFTTVDANMEALQELRAMLNSGFVPTSVIIGRDGEMIGEPIVGSSVPRFSAAIENALQS